MSQRAEVNFKGRKLKVKSRVARIVAPIISGACLLLMLPTLSATTASAAPWMPGTGVPNPCVAAASCTYGYIVASAVPALVSMGDGVSAEATNLGVGYSVQSIGFNPSEQLTVMDNMISQGVSAIITSPLDVGSIQAGITAATAAGIPVIFYDGSTGSAASPGLTLNVINLDQNAGEYMVGQIAAKLKSEGKKCALGLVDGITAVPALDHRDLGMAAGAKKYGCKVLSTQTDTADTASAAATIAEQWKSQFGSKMTGVVSYNDDAETGVYGSVAGSSWKPVLVSFNGENAELKLLAAGKVYEDDALANAVIGEGMAYGAYQVLKGKTVPTTVESPYYLLTKKNAKSFTTDADILAKPVGRIAFGQSGSTSILTDSAFKS
jgi:ribose transport system substrate-binding protein